MTLTTTSCTSASAEKVTAAGMKLTFGFSALPPSTCLEESIKGTLEAAERTIVREVCEFYKRTARDLQTQLRTIKGDLQRNLNAEDFSNFTHRLRKHEDKEERQCYATKKKKLWKLLQTRTESSKKERNSKGAGRSKKNRHFRRRHTRTPEPGQVVNLSSVDLTEEQTQLLACGPKFCPTPGSYDEVQLLDDVKEGLRRVRLREFWFDEDAPAQLPTSFKFYKKTHWEPPKDRDQALEAFSSSVITKVTSHSSQPPQHQNLSKNTRKAMTDLKQLVKDRIIRISPADKGGAVVVQDFHQYYDEAMRQLSNTHHYENLSSDPTGDIAKTSNELLRELHAQGYVDDGTLRWGLVDEKSVRTHTFYHLPKIHKDPSQPPGRPIVSGINGPTEKLSKLVDFWIQPAVHQLPSYIKDTTNLLKVIQDWNSTLGPLPEDVLLVTIDVVALYPNIPHSEVTSSLTAMLQDPTRPMPSGPPLQMLLKIVDHVLSNNVFDFDGKIYRQIHGTAMGTPMAPSIANIFMGCLERHLLSSSSWQVNPKMWRRFIDDILILWTHGEHQLKNFIDWLKSQHHTIKFTSNHGRSRIPFLDVSMSVVEGIIVTDVHIKPTDAHMYLPFNSCHPRHCMRGIPHGQALRLRRICSEEDTLKLRSKELQGRLEKRGYPKSLVETAIAKVAELPRDRTLDYSSNKKQSGRVPFVVTHNPSHPPLSLWLRDLMPVLHTSRRMQKAMPKVPIVGERNSKNLRNLLMPSRLPPPPPPIAQAPGCRRCTAKRCILCLSHLKDSDTFTSVRTGTCYTIRDTVGCKSSNIIYLINCARCRDVQYKGETGQTASRRFHSHRSNIGVGDAARSSGGPSTNTQDSSWRRETLVAKHFQNKDHSVKDMEVVIIEQIHVQNIQLRKTRERFWRHKLKTNYPQGLNVWD